LKDHRRYDHEKEELFEAKTKIQTHKCEACHKGHPSYDALRMHKKVCEEMKRLLMKVMEEPPEDTDLEDNQLEEPKPKNATEVLKKYVK